MLVLAIVLSLFVGRLLQLQGVDASSYVAEAEEQRRTHQVIPAKRGTITDAHGVVLATTVPTVDIAAHPNKVTDPRGTAAVLAPILKMEADDLYDKLADRDRTWVILASGLEPAVWQQIDRRRRAEQRALEGMADPGARPPARLAAVDWRFGSKRVYPSGTVAANVLGFVRPGQDGRPGRADSGIEGLMDRELAGRDGEAFFERSVGVGGAQIPSRNNTASDPVPGRNVTLTIDRDIQWTAQQAIAAQVRRTGAESGTVLVTEPSTGRTLALATAPSFDPNHYGRARLEDLGNRALSEVYEPGSTGKIMTLAAAIEAGAALPSTRVTVPPGLKRGAKTIRDHEPLTNPRLTLTGVMAKSSNIGTVLTAERLGRDRLYDSLKRFGIGEHTGLDRYGGFGESRGMLARPPDWSDVQAANIAFGQGYSLNAVQATGVFATIANGGVRVQPSLIKGTSDAEGRFVPAPEPARVRVVSEATARHVAEMMESVVSPEGTAPVARIPGYRVAGKTGTAQRVDPKTGRYSQYTASFIGFAPADKPAVVVSVTLQNPRRGHYGGTLAGPVFREVTSFALKTLKVPPTGTPPPRLPVTW
jgi:cell division protein FtsI (penicillin-binding protein 3)